MRIKLKRSDIPLSVPSTNDLQVGEVALNTADQKIYAMNSLEEIVEVASKGQTADEVATKATIMAIALG